MWKSLETESVAYPFHRIGKFLYYGALLCVPSGFREFIIHYCHESTGYKGFRPLLRAGRTELFWGNVLSEVTEWIGSKCQRCFEFKATGCKPQGRLHPFPLPREDFTQISCDFATLPESYGMDQVLVVVDQATRYLTLVPLRKTDGAREVWTLIEDSIFLPLTSH